MRVLKDETGLQGIWMKSLYLNLSLCEAVIGFPVEESGWYYHYASYYAKKGQKDLALEWLAKDLEIVHLLDNDPRKDNDLRLLWDD